MTKRTILLIEDNDLLADALVRMLKMHDFNVLHAADGVEGVRTVMATSEIHAVVSDLMMPRKNGKQAMEAILKIRPELADRYMIISAGTQIPDLAKWLTSLTNYLEKPFSNSDLLSWIDGLPTAEP